MTIHRFELFVAVAKHLSITQASREFHVSQPAVSQQLKRLQADFGTTLINKNGKGIELTESGRFFYKEVQSILAQVEALRKKYVRSLDHTGVTSLTVAGSHGPSTFLLPSLLARFKKSHPAVKLTLNTGVSRDIEKLILASKVDLAVITNPTTSAWLRKEPYRREQLTAFVRANHPLAKKKEIRATELPHIPLVVRVGRRGHTRTEERLVSFGATGGNLKIAMRCESPESVKEAVRNGAGVGILYHDIVRRDVERGEFKVVTLSGMDIFGQSYIVYSSERPLSATAREFLTLLRAAAKKPPPSKMVARPGKSRFVQPLIRHR